LGGVLIGIFSGISPTPALLMKELSEREVDVLRVLATGASNKEIAKELCISINTVKVHLRNIYSKLDIQCRVQAVMYAIKNNLLVDLV
jgi:NarL family two-component system response regulator LiaR